MYRIPWPLSIVHATLRRSRIVSGSAKRESLLSLADQTVVSGVTFLTTILLGRSCGAEQLGIYALGFTVVVFVSNVQMALITIPYTNQWRGRAEVDRDGFAGIALLQQSILAALMSVIIGLVAGSLWLSGLYENVNSVLFVVAVMLPVLLAREFARRFSFAHLRMGTALAIDSIVSILQVAGIVALFAVDQLSARTAYIALGVCAGIGSISALATMRGLFVIRWDLLRRAALEHWEFGRWVLATSVLTTFQAYVVHWLLAFVSGTADTGVYAACMTIVLLLNPLLLGFSNFLGPKTAKAFADGGRRQLRAIVWKACLGLGGIMVLYCILVFIVGDRVISLLYHGSEYSGHGHLLTVLAITCLIGAIDFPAMCGLRAMNHPDVSFLASGASALVTLAGGLTLIPPFEMLGGAYAVLIGQSFGMSLRNLMFARLSRPKELEGGSDDARKKELLCCSVGVAEERAR